jgi:hypothetical protein
MSTLFISVPIINAYTYDSDIDPEAINKWNLLKMVASDGYLLTAYKNPNTAEKISAAVLLYRRPGICVAFTYYKNHEAHLFLYDQDTNHYTRAQDQKWSKFIGLMEKMLQVMLGHVSI